MYLTAITLFVVSSPLYAEQSCLDRCMQQCALPQSTSLEQFFTTTAATIPSFDAWESAYSEAVQQHKAARQFITQQPLQSDMAAARQRLQQHNEQLKFEYPKKLHELFKTELNKLTTIADIEALYKKATALAQKITIVRAYLPELEHDYNQKLASLSTLEIKALSTWARQETQRLIDACLAATSPEELVQTQADGADMLTTLQQRMAPFTHHNEIELERRAQSTIDLTKANIKELITNLAVPFKQAELSLMARINKAATPEKRAILQDRITLELLPYEKQTRRLYAQHISDYYPLFDAIMHAIKQAQKKLKALTDPQKAHTVQ